MQLNPTSFAPPIIGLTDGNLSSLVYPLLLYGWTCRCCSLSLSLSLSLSHLSKVYKRLGFSLKPISTIHQGGNQWLITCLTEGNSGHINLGQKASSPLFSRLSFVVIWLNLWLLLSHTRLEFALKPISIVHQGGNQRLTCCWIGLWAYRFFMWRDIQPNRIMSTGA
jgi:hypothetical protein